MGFSDGEIRLFSNLTIIDKIILDNHCQCVKLTMDVRRNGSPAKKRR